LFRLSGCTSASTSTSNPLCPSVEYEHSSATPSGDTRPSLSISPLVTSGADPHITSFAPASESTEDPAKMMLPKTAHYHQHSFYSTTAT
jgi:hypothetical protein